MTNKLPTAGIEPIRFPGASTPRSTPDQPPFGPALAQADSAGRNDATRENGASDSPGSKGPLKLDAEASEPDARAFGEEPSTGSVEPATSPESNEAAFDAEGASDPEATEATIVDPSSIDAPIARPQAGLGLDASIVDGIEFIGEPTASTGTSSRSSGAEPSIEGLAVASAVDQTIGSTTATDPGAPVISDAVVNPGAETSRSRRGAIESSSAIDIGAGSLNAPTDDSVARRSVPGLDTPAGLTDAGPVDPSTIMRNQGAEAVVRSPSGEVVRTETGMTAGVEPRAVSDTPGRIEITDGRSPSDVRSGPATQEAIRTSAARRRSDASDERRPAAVARADKINQAVQDARAQSTSSPSAPSPVVSSITQGSARAVPSAAQTLPNPSAGAAPDAGEEGRGRTMPGVGRGLETLARQRGGTLTMRLDPPSLGQLKLEMRMDAGRVTVLLTSASDSARSLLRDNLGSLRQALEDRGLAVDRLAVESAGRTSEGSSNQRSENRGDGQDARGGQDAAGRQDAGDGRSRGRRDDASNRPADREGDSQRPEVANFDEAMVQATVSEH